MPIVRTPPTHEEFRKMAEYRIQKVIERLNDRLGKKNKGRGLWLSGGLDDDNSLEISYRKE